LTMRFAKGILTAPESGVVALLFCHDMFQRGNSLRKKDAMWFWAVVWPGVPGTRGIRRGVRRVPLKGSRAWSGEGIALRKESERGLYATTMVVYDRTNRHSEIARKVNEGAPILAVRCSSREGISLLS